MLIRETVQLHKVGERGRSCYKLCLSPGLLPHDASKQLSNCPPPQSYTHMKASMGTFGFEILQVGRMQHVLIGV
jgi:hypothetical protein